MQFRLNVSMMKMFVIFFIVLQVAITISQKGSASSRILSEDLRRYRILRSLSIGHPFGLISISKQLAKPAVPDDAIKRKDPWVDGIFRSLRKK